VSDEAHRCVPTEFVCRETVSFVVDGQMQNLILFLTSSFGSQFLIWFSFPHSVLTSSFGSHFLIWFSLPHSVLTSSFGSHFLTHLDTPSLHPIPPFSYPRPPPALLQHGLPGLMGPHQQLRGVARPDE
jgi:hypothetical protein